jgi:hypothetical protein
MSEPTEDEMLALLGAKPERKKVVSRTPKEARIIAGFEDILKFFEEHGRLPQHGAAGDIFERLYATRLDALRRQPDSCALLADMDAAGWLNQEEASFDLEEVEEDALLEALGAGVGAGGADIGTLRHVRSTAEKKAAEEIASRTPCKDFDTFAPLFDAIKRQLKSGDRETRKFERKAEIEIGRFFIVSGLMAYVADGGEVFTNDSGFKDQRLRVIYDNGTESDLLARSLQKALSQDEAGRRITEPNAGPLFGGDVEDDDTQSGLIYVLRSLSKHPEIVSRQKVLHKIGVTGGELKARIANAANEATYLLADVEIAATYTLYNINRGKLEKLLHRIFSAARADFEIEDRFGKPVRPREWFLVPLEAIDRAVQLIQSGEIERFHYVPKEADFEPSIEAK